MTHTRSMARVALFAVMALLVVVQTSASIAQYVAYFQSNVGSEADGVASVLYNHNANTLQVGVKLYYTSGVSSITLTGPANFPNVSMATSILSMPLVASAGVTAGTYFTASLDLNLASTYGAAFLAASGSVGSASSALYSALQAMQISMSVNTAAYPNLPELTAVVTPDLNQIVYQGPLAIVPGVSSTQATGSVTIVILTGTQSAFFYVNYYNLASNLTASHLHGCTSNATTGSAGIAIPFVLPYNPKVNGSFSNYFDLTLAATYNSDFFAASGGTTVGAYDQLQNCLYSGNMYINLHDGAWPNGEVRSFPPIVDFDASILNVGAVLSYAAILTSFGPAQGEILITLDTNRHQLILQGFAAGANGVFTSLYSTNSMFNFTTGFSTATSNTLQQFYLAIDTSLIASYLPSYIVITGYTAAQAEADLAVSLLAQQFAWVLTTSTQSVGGIAVSSTNVPLTSAQTSTLTSATGNSTLTLDLVNHVLYVRSSFANLNSTFTAAHIHACAAGSASNYTSGPAISLGAGFVLSADQKSGVFNHAINLLDSSIWIGDFLTAAGCPLAAEQALYQCFERVESYINVHSVLLPNGEARGQVVRRSDPLLHVPSVPAGYGPLVSPTGGATCYSVPIPSSSSSGSNNQGSSGSSGPSGNSTASSSGQGVPTVNPGSGAASHTSSLLASAVALLVAAAMIVA